MAVTYATRKSSSEKLHPFCHRPAPFFLFFHDDSVGGRTRPPPFQRRRGFRAFNVAVRHKNLALVNDLTWDGVKNIDLIDYSSSYHKVYFILTIIDDVYKNTCRM